MPFKERNMKTILLSLLILIVSAGNAFAEINVVATLPWIGSISKEIGKDKIGITVLVKPDQDPHHIEAKPGMILAARKADIIMYNGLDLEAGYLPVIIESSRNPKIQPGRQGNLDCSSFIEPIEKMQSADRSMGDIHPLGNPHYHLSPKNILKAAEGIAQALSRLDASNAGFYHANFSSFKKRLQEKQRQWQAMPLKGKKFIAYHKYFEYLAHETGFQIAGYVESKPGIPPSSAHIERLIETIKTTKPNALLTLPYYGQKEAGFISQKTGIKILALPADVGAANIGADAKDWFGFMDGIMEALWKP
jgi:zinc/manganese transport system substrate-binding protein